MRMTPRRLLAVPTLALALLASAPASAASTLSCGDLQDLITIYLQKHVAFRKLDDPLRERAVDGYLRQVDPQRSVLLQGDAERLAAELRLAFRDVRQAECKRLRSIHQHVVKRHADVEQQVRGVLAAEDYAVDESAELTLDPEKRERPATLEERNARLGALIDFQMSNYLAADHDLDDAKQRLVHRYELRTRRWAEQDKEEVYSAFLDAVANALDPHSDYLSADDLEDFRIGMQLSLEGIGVALSERDGYSVVEQIIPGGAADRLGVLKPKDKIIAVGEDGDEPVDVIDMELRDVVRLIRGKKGSRVRLVVLRQAEATERFPVVITREKIDLEQQAAKLSFETVGEGEGALKLAVLELPSFYGDRDPRQRQCSRDVARHLAKVVEEKADGLVLDLSRNGGGMLEDAVKISGFFIREGGVVAIKDGGDNSRVLNDPDDDILYSGPMVVLTSRVSASASEILAGALRDYRRAVIVGDDHTFGKGTVQSVFPLRPGLGALRVTTAMFFRPGGASTQHTGVASNVVVPSPFNLDTFGEGNHQHSLPTQSIAPFLSPRANGTLGKPRWEPVSSEALGQLAQRSEVRVGRSEEFQEIEQELDRRRNDDGVIRLGEMLEERQAARNGEGSGEEEATAADNEAEAEEDAEEPATPQLAEALQILADLVQLQRVGESGLAQLQP